MEWSGAEPACTDDLLSEYVLIFIVFNLHCSGAQGSQKQPRGVEGAQVSGLGSWILTVPSRPEFH